VYTNHDRKESTSKTRYTSRTNDSPLHEARLMSPNKTH
jgi:hypothetical protein